MKKSWLKFLFKTLITLLFLYLFKISVEEGSAHLFHLRWDGIEIIMFMFLGVTTFFVVTLIMTVRWQISIKLLDLASGGSSSDTLENRDLSLAVMYQVYCFSQFIGLSTIGYLGTDGGRIAYTKVNGKSSLVMTKNLLLERAISLIALGFWCLLFLSAKISLFIPVLLVLLFFISPFLLVLKERNSLLLKSLLLAMVGHLIKLSFLVFVILKLSELHVFNSFENASAFHSFAQTNFETSFALFVESLPISWKGAGVGHYSFSQFVTNAKGIDAYRLYFQSKILFLMLCSGFYFLPSFREKIWSKL